ncbi:hypothetical protein Taro_051570, partial [Colocasia esculenta]|nr:hypothetical protein [Colocasia esculenta]
VEAYYRRWVGRVWLLVWMRAGLEEVLVVELVGLWAQKLVELVVEMSHEGVVKLEEKKVHELERADVWWASLLRTQFEDRAIDVAWDEFMRLFRAKFVPEHIQDRMEQEFLSLTQGPMTVLEYEARFAELSKYAPHIVTDERRKAKKFVMGLKPSLRTRLVAFDHHTLDEALSAACRQEGKMQQYLEEKKASQKRPAATFQLQDKKKVVYHAPQRPVTTSSAQTHSLLRRTNLVGDPTPLEETVESDSERGE